MMIEPRSVAGINGRLNGGWARYPDGIVALGVGVWVGTLAAAVAACPEDVIVLLVLAGFGIMLIKDVREEVDSLAASALAVLP